MASEVMTVTVYCKPGRAMPEFALQVNGAMKQLMDVYAAQHGYPTSFELTKFEWVDDGVDEITLSITLPDGMDADMTAADLTALLEAEWPKAPANE